MNKCETCWTRYGRDLWEGSCICTGHVSNKPHQPTHSNPLKPKPEPAHKVLQQGYRFVIRRCWPDGRCERFGREEGETKAGATVFPMEILSVNSYENKEDADAVLVRYLAYLSDHKKRKRN